MDLAAPFTFLLLPVVMVGLWFFHSRSYHPMSLRRRRFLTVTRMVLLVLIIAALAGPAWLHQTGQKATIFVFDHSRSQTEIGLKTAYARAEALKAQLPGHCYTGFLSAGENVRVLQKPKMRAKIPELDLTTLEENGAQTDLAQAVNLATGLFPAGANRRLIILTDGVETQGDLRSAAREASAAGITIDAVPIRGPERPDIRVVQLRTSRSRLREGADLGLNADVESSHPGKGMIRLFENGIEVASKSLTIKAGEEKTVKFQRTPFERNLYTYRARVEGFPNDSIPENNDAMALVDVRGRPLVLYVEGDRGEARYLRAAMQREGIRLQIRGPESLPETPQGLAGFDSVILSDVPAHKLSERAMVALRDYVEKLGGGFLMIGGKNSFGVGGYYRTPVEKILPVKMIPPDVEEKHVIALALVLDRSGSMQGQKVELCKSAALATVEILKSKDYVGIVAFDSAARWVVPMTKARSKSTISAQIATINAGGGTNIHPGMTSAHQALQRVKARVKHMIVLSDGHTSGSGYEQLATRIHSDGITISTVAVGSSADANLLQNVAAAGNGQFYRTFDPTSIPQIFTQDTMVHTGRLIKEEAFSINQVEQHPMLEGWPAHNAPELLGYVKTDPRATSQVPLVTQTGAPLLAHWRFGLGKVTAFTSDAKSRWASLWITGWRSGYSQFWAQVLRETMRKPQGQLMDIRLTQKGQKVDIAVEVLEDPGHYDNEAEVTANVFFVPSVSLGASMKQINQLNLSQQGPGRYSGSFRPTKPGVYLVRARAGAKLVSAGLVHNVSGETATGRMDLALLADVCKITGGKVLASEDARLSPLGKGQKRRQELAPLLLKILLLIFLIDLAIRRWENIQSAGRWFGRRWKTLVGS
ncbi:MAG: VWA domain-containing protein [Candidatus Brocadiia bacterium]